MRVRPYIFTVFHAGRMHERQNEKHVSTIEFGWIG